MNATTIDKRNAEFQALTDKQKRVKIAEDVLAQVAARKIVPAFQAWVRAPSHDFPDDTQVQTVFRALPSCKACALGSMFLCAVDISNNLRLNQIESFASQELLVDEFVVFQYLMDFFPREMLNKIEMAFEEGHGRCRPKGAEEGDIALMLYHAPNAEYRIRSLMEYLIKNEGEFPPPDEAFKEWVKGRWQEYAANEPVHAYHEE